MLLTMICLWEDEVQQLPGSEDGQCGMMRDTEDAVAERIQELEVLQSVFDQDLQVIAAPEISRLPDGVFYRVAMRNTTSPTATCLFYVFPFAGYPTRARASFLFYQPNQSPLLLRMINHAIIDEAAKIWVDGPIGFDIITYVSGQLAEWHHQYEQQQLPQPKSLDEPLPPTSEGKRQKAKLQGAARAYDYEWSEQQKHTQRGRLNENRLKQIQASQQNIRSIMAERVIQQRELEALSNELDKVGRVAMTQCLDDGGSVGVAREAAERAKENYQRERGLIPPRPDPETVLPSTD
jgi:hypothetical protein